MFNSNKVVVSSSASFAIDNSMFVVDGSYEQGYDFDQDVFFMLGLEFSKDYCFVGMSNGVDANKPQKVGTRGFQVFAPKLRTAGLRTTNRISDSMRHGVSSICEGDTDGDCASLI